MLEERTDYAESRAMGHWNGTNYRLQEGKKLEDSISTLEKARRLRCVDSA